jgi:hypothetical protein
VPELPESPLESVVNPSTITDEDEDDWVVNSINNMKTKKKMNKYKIKFENIYAIIFRIEKEWRRSVI